MAFDETKDKLIAGPTALGLDAKTDLEVSLYSYDGGPPKIHISRIAENKSGGKIYAKLGRITPEEWRELVDVVGEMLKSKNL